MCEIHVLFCFYFASSVKNLLSVVNAWKEKNIRRFKYIITKVKVQRDVSTKYPSEKISCVTLFIYLQYDFTIIKRERVIQLCFSSLHDNHINQQYQQIIQKKKIHFFSITLYNYYYNFLQLSVTLYYQSHTAHIWNITYTNL